MNGDGRKDAVTARANVGAITGIWSLFFVYRAHYESLEVQFSYEIS